MGEAGRPHPIPWMISHERDKKEMDSEIRSLEERKWKLLKRGQLTGMTVRKNT